MISSLKIAIRFTLVTTVLLGLLYPLAVTAFAHIAMRDKADGQLLSQNGHVIGSAILGQSFAGDRYFHGRLSAAGNGYDAANSGGTNLAQSSKKLVDRINGDAATYSKTSSADVPIDLVTTSGSGLDPDITPAAALYQVSRVAQARHMDDASLRALVQAHTQGRQFGILGEPRVNVLELNMALDAAH
ncbi:potassium-transporting ATPase subunit KdpC [Silvibacterium acidisoli]|uniref:potassium-transporting ATPase subunit KdpC n=1 Tax=Acidobacteriaceae bacterium ZG23-2 TaxID=2883246 RepID=UPI00406C8387